MGSIVAAVNPHSARWDDAVALLRNRYGETREWRGAAARIAVGGKGASLQSDGTASLALLGWTRTNDDVGRLLHAYQSKGLAAFDRLRGRFSFVVCDERRGTFAGGRDVLGRSGLAWCAQPPAQWFASEVLTLVANARRPRWNRLYLADWLLGFASQVQTVTAFDGIERCSPGEIIDLGHDQTRRRFDQIDPARESCDPVAEFGDILISNVRRLGPASSLMFSGGLDSTAIAIAMAKSGRAVRTATYLLPSGGEDSEDRRRSEYLRSHPDAQSVTLKLDSASITSSQIDSFARFLRVLDDPPIGSPALLPARRALLELLHKNEVETVIDGEGGDEIFEMAVCPLDLWQARSRLRALHLIATDHRFRHPLARTRFLLGIASSEIVERRFASQTKRTTGIASAELIQGAEGREAIEAFRSRLRLATFEERLVAILLSAASEASRAIAHRLADDLGMESESPLWDPDVVELALALPLHLRLRHGVVKVFIRTVLDGAVHGMGRRELLPVRSFVATNRMIARAIAHLVPERLDEVDLLDAWVDRRALGDVLDGPRSSADEDFLIRLYFGATWMSEIQDAFGVA